MFFLLLVVVLREHICRNLLIVNTSELFITLGPWGQDSVGSTHNPTVML
jgi:hypothetical protein